MPLWEGTFPKTLVLKLYMPGCYECEQDIHGKDMHMGSLYMRRLCMLKSMLVNGYTCAKIAYGELCLWRVLYVFKSPVPFLAHEQSIVQAVGYRSSTVGHTVQALQDHSTLSTGIRRYTSQ